MIYNTPTPLIQELLESNYRYDDIMNWKWNFRTDEYRWHDKRGYDLESIKKIWKFNYKNYLEFEENITRNIKGLYWLDRYLESEWNNIVAPSEEEYFLLLASKDFYHRPKPLQKWDLITKATCGFDFEGAEYVIDGKRNFTFEDYFRIMKKRFSTIEEFLEYLLGDNEYLKIIKEWFIINWDNIIPYSDEQRKII